MKNQKNTLLKYGFEFIVVFLGLLLSLAIDNYSKKAEKLKKKNTLLIELEESITNDVVQLGIVNKSLDQAIESVKFILEDGKKSDSLIAFHVSNISAKTAISFFPQKGIYSQLINSNSFELIDNTKLRSRIIDLYEHLEDRKDAADLKNDFFVESFDKSILNKINYRIQIVEVDNSVDLNTKIINYEVDQDILIDKVFIGYITNAEKRIYYYKELLKKYKNVMSEILLILNKYWLNIKRKNYTFRIYNSKSTKMNIKTIFKINIALLFLQALPLYISLFSPEFKMMLTTDAFGSDPSPDAIIIFEQFALVLGLLVLGIISLVYGSLSFTDINVLKRISFLLFALSGFFALPDLINVFTGQPTAPLPVIIMGLITLGLFYYGSKKGTI